MAIFLFLFIVLHVLLSTNSDVAFALIKSYPAHCFRLECSDIVCQLISDFKMHTLIGQLTFVDSMAEMFAPLLAGTPLWAPPPGLIKAKGIAGK